MKEPNDESGQPLDPDATRLAGQPIDPDATLLGGDDAGQPASHPGPASHPDPLSGADADDATVLSDTDAKPEDPSPPLVRAFGLAKGVMIDHYRLVRQIGQGGMGEVWEAEQEEPVRRTVALKLIRTGMDSGQFVVRFEAERQALALMDHECIARIFDAGTTESGSPYFVMEHVAGIPLIQYCDRHQMDTESRLRLFMRVCDGVQHAHQKAIIHRDLKPGNILVAEQDGEPIPKIIDFGVAKATGEKLTDQTMMTSAGAMIGTLEYMSPEQLEGDHDIDTRTDVYALGVILYELLAGELPFDSKQHASATLFEMANIIRDHDPPRPSTRLGTRSDEATTAARRRASDARSLSRNLAGDLDWITMMALEKDRARRYASPRELATDVQRYLNLEPVSAGAPTSGYRMRKFARRHRAAVFAAGAITAALVLGLTAATYGLLKARRAEADVRREVAKAEAVNDFLHGMLSSASPDQAQGREVTVREVLDAASSEVGSGALPEEREVEAAVRNTIGATYQALGLYEAAEPHFESALKTRQELHSGDNPEISESLHSLGRLRWAMSDYAAAEQLIQEALDMNRRLHGNEMESVVACLGDLAVVSQTQGDYARAEPMLRESLALSRELFGSESDKVADNLNNLGWALHFQGRTDEAEELFHESLDINRALLGDKHPRVLVSTLNFAAILDYQGKQEEAEAMYIRTSTVLREVLGAEHPTMLQSLQSLGEFYLRLDRVDEAEPLLAEAKETAERTLGADHSLTITLLADLGWVHRAGGDLATAEPFYRETLSRRARSLGEEHPHTLRSRWQLARILVDQDKFEDAELVVQPSLAIARQVLPAGNENLSSTLVFLGLALSGQDRAAEAEPLLRECVTAREGSLPEGSWEIGHARSALGEALALQAHFGQAEPLLLRGYQEIEASAASPPIRLRRAVERLLHLYEDWSTLEPGDGHKTSAVEWRLRLATLNEDDPNR